MSTAPFKVKAVYEYTSPHEDDLSFPNGQIITVTEEEDADWYVGEYTDSAGVKQEGLFPKNFVERHEPEAPPRPSRTRPKKETSIPAESQPVPSALPEPTPLDEPAAPETVAEQIPPPVSTQTKPVERKAEPPKPQVVEKSAPPAVAEKPSSFKDRIAAFNKGADPVAPIKPSVPSGGNTFIKKPFVAPPPSRDAYVPPPTRQAAPQKVYRREEDPEIAERQAQDQLDAERAGLSITEQEAETEDAPKVTSLKDRIALLQQEQAARRAEASQKEKPKKPPAKKRTDSSDRVATVEGQDPDVGRVSLDSTTKRQSSEIPRDFPTSPPPGRKVSRDLSIEEPPREIFSDENDADQSGAGDTTEDAEGTSTEVEDEDLTNTRPQLAPSRTLTATSKKDLVAEPEAEIEDAEDAEEDEETDPEIRRKNELRERMAKMSGGMGMAGILGGPGMPMPGMTSRKKRPSGTSDHRQSLEGEPVSPPPTQRVPMVPVPGIARVSTGASEDTALVVEKEEEPGLPLSSTRSPEEVPDVEDLEQKPAPSAPLEGRAAPPVPKGKNTIFMQLFKRHEDRVKALQGPRATVHNQHRKLSVFEERSEFSVVSEGRNRPLPPPPPTTSRDAPPPIPGDRPVPSAPSSRAVPPPPPRAPLSPTPGSESEDEAPTQPRRASAQSPTSLTEKETPTRAPPPPVPGTSVSPPQRSFVPQSPPTSTQNRGSFIGEQSSASTSPANEKRASRPPVPPPADSRPPPPPPPTSAPPKRLSTDQVSDNAAEDGESDYEGDYDTDIAPSASHKDALRAHDRHYSVDEETLSGEKSIKSPLIAPPPVPQTQQRDVPPIPSEPAPHGGRQSTEAPRAVPPVPPPREPVIVDDDDEYDPYRYGPSQNFPLPPPRPSVPPPATQEEDRTVQNDYTPPTVDRPPPPIPPQSPPLHDRAPPPPVPPPEPSATTSRHSRDVSRKSTEAQRSSINPTRRSAEHTRTSTDQGYIARDISLDEPSQWWTQPEAPPPVFQNRSDLLYEVEQSSTSKRGGRTIVSKDVYVLFQDYSQTIVTARFDPKEPAGASIEQRHEPPPAKPRQDELESAYNKFGIAIGSEVGAKQNQTVGDGTAQALVLDLLRPHGSALLPIGTRAYGALVYANMGNATVQQFDEIRPGDIISFRNAKFQGKHGNLAKKYSEEVGKPDHVGVVSEWDGTKKKVRAYEQGRESRKVKVESFRMTDLRSGEVKVWRIVGRAWVNWEGQS